VGVKKRVNQYPRAFQLMALERMKHCENVCALAKELGIARTVLYPWKHHLKAIEGGAADFPIRELREQLRDRKRVLAAHSSLNRRYDTDSGGTTEHRPLKPPPTAYACCGFAQSRTGGSYRAKPYS